MKRRTWWIASVAVAVLSLAGYAAVLRTIPVGQFRPPYQVLTYSKGRRVGDRPLVPGSREEKTVTRWLRAHPTGWRSDWNSYAQGTCIRGAGFKLNLLSGICVLNYRASPQDSTDVQVSRPIPVGDDLRAILANELEDRRPHRKPPAP